MSGSLSIARLSGVLFFGFYFFNYGLFPNGRSFAPMPPAMRWFLAYAGIFALNTLLRPAEGYGFDLTALFTLAQLLVFFWFTSDLLKSDDMMRLALLAYAAACVLLAFGMVVGVPGFATGIGEGRIEAMGDNPNASGQHLTLAALILIGLTLSQRFPNWIMRKILVPLGVLVLLAGMVATGSRSAIVSFIIGCAIYLFPYRHSKRLMMSVLLGAVGIGAVIYLIAKNPDFVERWQATYYEEDLSGRQDIYGSAIQMFSEEPLLGWSPAGAFYELGRRVGWNGGRDVHNLILDLLIGVGLLGALPFLIGLGLCVREAWRARGGSLSLLFLTLLVANLSASMTHTNVTWKPQWFVLALACAAASSAVRRSARFAPMLRARQRIRPIRWRSRRPSTSLRR